MGSIKLNDETLFQIGPYEGNFKISHGCSVYTLCVEGVTYRAVYEHRAGRASDSDPFEWYGEPLSDTQAIKLRLYG